MSNFTIDGLNEPQYLELFKNETIDGFQVGVQAAIGYVGKFAYLPFIALLAYAIAKRIPVRYDFYIIKPGHRWIKEMKFREAFEKTIFALALAASAGMAMIVYTKGSVLQLQF